MAGVVVAGIGVFKWMLKSHEDVCAERYAGILANQRKQDERHSENVVRIESVRIEVRDANRATDQKLDSIIRHLLDE